MKNLHYSMKNLHYEAWFYHLSWQYTHRCSFYIYVCTPTEFYRAVITYRVALPPHMALRKLDDPVITATVPWHIAIELSLNLLIRNEALMLLEMKLTIRE